MCRLRSRTNKSLILAAGLMVSCSLNPQPEPPGAEATSHPSGGERSMGTGGWHNDANTSASSAGGAAAGLGGAAGGTQPPNNSIDRADASDDAGVDEFDAGREPVTTPSPSD